MEIIKYIDIEKDLHCSWKVSEIKRIARTIIFSDIVMSMLQRDRKDMLGNLPSFVTTNSWKEGSSKTIHSILEAYIQFSI